MFCLKKKERESRNYNAMGNVWLLYLHNYTISYYFDILYNTLRLIEIITNIRLIPCFGAMLYAESRGFPVRENIKLEE